MFGKKKQDYRQYGGSNPESGFRPVCFMHKPDAKDE
jgi:hypothetical protein